MREPFTPRRHQVIGTAHALENRRCNLWADPGLGKTAMVLNVLEALHLMGSRFAEPALVLAPLNVARRVWSDEAALWEHLDRFTVRNVVGTADDRRRALRGKGQVYVTNYENVQWLVDKVGNDWPFRFVIADESTKLKSFRLRNGGKRAAALAKIVKHTGRWVNLTGTPSPNGLTDLWGQAWFLDGGERLGRTYTQFIKRWFEENKYTHAVEPHDWAHDEIIEALSDVTLSLEASDYMDDLPELIEQTIHVSLPPRAMKVYRDFETQLLTELSENNFVIAGSVADKTMKCLQVCSGALYTDGAGSAHETLHSAKIDALKDLVDELGGKSLIVAYHFRHDLARLQQAFPSGRPLNTTQNQDRWNAGSLQIGFAHPASIGHGINLQHGGHHLAFFSHDWSLENYQQIIERIGPVRQKQAGYNRPVFIYHIQAQDTVDEDVLLRLNGKADVQSLLRARLKA